MKNPVFKDALKRKLKEKAPDALLGKRGSLKSRIAKILGSAKKTGKAIKDKVLVPKKPGKSRGRQALDSIFPKV